MDVNQAKALQIQNGFINSTATPWFESDEQRQKRLQEQQAQARLAALQQLRDQAGRPSGY